MFTAVNSQYESKIQLIMKISANVENTILEIYFGIAIKHNN